MATAMWSVISFRSVKNCLELEEAHSSSSTNITQAQLDWDKPFKVTHMSDLQTERDKSVLFFHLPLKSHRHQEKPKKQIFSRMQLFLRDLLIVTCTILRLHSPTIEIISINCGYIFNISYKMLWMCSIRKKPLHFLF